MKATDLLHRGRRVTESDEPAPAPRSAGWTEGGSAAEDQDESTRACAQAREADSLAVPPVPQMMRMLFIRGDGESPSVLRGIMPRFWDRVDYAFAGEWCRTHRVEGLSEQGARRVQQRERTKRWLYFLLYTLPIAAPIALAVDLIDWATHPLGRLLVTGSVVWLLCTIL